MRNLHACMRTCQHGTSVPVLRTDWRSICPHPCFDPSSCGSAARRLPACPRPCRPSRLRGRSYHAMLDLLHEGGSPLPPLRTGGNRMTHMNGIYVSPFSKPRLISTPCVCDVAVDLHRLFSKASYQYPGSIATAETAGLKLFSIPFPVVLNGSSGSAHAKREFRIRLTSSSQTAFRFGLTNFTTEIML